MVGLHQQRADLAVTARDVFTEEFYKNLDRLFKTLTQRDFGEKHWTEIEALIKSLSEKLGLVDVDVTASALGKQTLSNSVLCRDVDFYQDCGRHQQPCFVEVLARQKLLSYSEIWHPVILGLQKVAVSHIKGSGSLFTPYEAEELLSSGLAFSKVLGEMTEFEERLQSDRGLHLCLADKNGLYLCQAKIIPPHEKDPFVNVCSDRSSGIAILTRREPEWTPRVRICVNVFLGKRELTKHQSNVYDLIRGFLSDPDMVSTREALAASFFRPKLFETYFSQQPLVRGRSVAFTQTIGNETATKDTIDSNALNEGMEAMRRSYSLIPKFENGIRALLLHPVYQWVFSRDENLLPEPESFTIGERRPAPRLQVCPLEGARAG